MTVQVFAALTRSWPAGCSSTGIDFDGKPNDRLAARVCRDFSVRVFKDFTLIHCVKDEPVHTFSIRRDYPNGSVFLDAAFEARRNREPITVTYYADPKDNQSACDPAVCRAVFAIELEARAR